MIHLTLPLPPSRGNARGHWAVHHRRKKTYWHDLDMLVVARQIPRAPAEPFPAANIAATLYLCGVTMDDDNAEARMKFALDWLVSRGYLADDNPRALHWEARVGQVRVPHRHNQRLEITLTPRQQAEAA